MGRVLRYCKIRILPKSTLYNPSCQAITWTDLWDIRFPTYQNNTAFNDFEVATIRPAVTFGTPGTEYFMASSPFFNPFDDFMVVFGLTDPLGTPALTADPVQVAPNNCSSNFPSCVPNANQKGGPP